MSIFSAPKSKTNRALSVLASVSLAGGLAFALAPAGPAAAGPIIDNSYDLSQGDWTVPEGVTAVQIIATGGKGGASNGNAGGPGCQVFASVEVKSGDTISAQIATDGGDGTSTAGSDPAYYPGGAGGTGAFAGGNGGSGIAGASFASGGGGGGATGVKLNSDYVAIAAGGAGASTHMAARQDYQCALVQYPVSFGLGSLPPSGAGSFVGAPNRLTGGTQFEGGSFDQAGNYDATCGTSRRVANPGSNGGQSTGDGAGIGGNGGDAGWRSISPTCPDGLLHTSRGVGAGGGGGGGFIGGGGGASSTSGSVAGPGAAGASYAPQTQTTSADFKTASGIPAGAIVKWATIDTDITTTSVGDSVNETISSTFGDGSDYSISLFGATATRTFSSSTLPTGWAFNTSTGQLTGTVPSSPVDITITATYTVSSWNPTYSYGTRTVAATSRTYHFGPVVPKLYVVPAPVSATYGDAKPSVDFIYETVLGDPTSAIDPTDGGANTGFEAPVCDVAVGQYVDLAVGTHTDAVSCSGGNGGIEYSLDLSSYADLEVTQATAAVDYTGGTSDVTVGDSYEFGANLSPAICGDVVFTITPDPLAANLGEGSREFAAGTQDTTNWLLQTYSVSADFAGNDNCVAASASSGSFKVKPLARFVTYSAGSATSGSAPQDPTAYAPGTAVVAAGNTGKLAIRGYKFVGWNTAADGSGISVAAGATYILDEDTVLYPQFKQISTKKLIREFKGDSSILKPGMKADIADWVKTLPAGATFVCVGSTSGKYKTAADLSLARKRAKTVCDYGLKVRWDLSYKVVLNPASDVVTKARHVWMYFNTKF